MHTTWVAKRDIEQIIIETSKASNKVRISAEIKQRPHAITVLTGFLSPFTLALWLNSKYFHARRKAWFQMFDQDQPWKFI